MGDCAATVRLATRPGMGGVSVLLLAGPEEALARVDASLSALRRRGQSPEPGTLVWGWLEDVSAVPPRRVDEVLLAIPRTGERMVTGHGGTASALALLDFCRSLGFAEGPAEADSYPAIAAAGSVAAEWERFLPLCATVPQAGLVLRAMQGEALAQKAVVDALRPRRWCLAGAPNTGKSSLLNRLCDRPRALVSPQAGTTLDAVEHWMEIGGLSCAVVDTAGFRREAGATEQEAMRRARLELEQADLVACLLDSSRPLDADDRLALKLVVQIRTLVLILNKADVCCAAWSEEGGAPGESLLAVQRLLPDVPLIRTCTVPGGMAEDGISALRALAAERMGASVFRAAGYGV